MVLSLFEQVQELKRTLRGPKPEIANEEYQAACWEQVAKTRQLLDEGASREANRAKYGAAEPSKSQFEESSSLLHVVLTNHENALDAIERKYNIAPVGDVSALRQENVSIFDPSDRSTWKFSFAKTGHAKFGPHKGKFTPGHGRYNFVDYVFRRANAMSRTFPISDGELADFANVGDLDLVDMFGDVKDAVQLTEDDRVIWRDGKDNKGSGLFWVDPTRLILI